MSGGEDRPDGLNSEQRRAAECLAGLLLIDAGAGSGKTRTLTERMVRAVTPGAVAGWEPADVDRILCITYTAKAAGEISERVRRALRRAGMQEDARRLDRAWLSTIHGMCARLLRKHSLDAGIDPQFRVLEGVEARELEERAFEDAAREAIRTPHGEALFGAYPFDRILKAVRSLDSEMRGRGLGEDALVAEPVPDARAVWSEAVECFSLARDGWEICPNVTKSANDHRDTCDAVIAGLRLMDVDRLDPDAIAAQVWQLLDSGSFGGKLLKGAEELLAILREERSRLLREAAAAAAAPMAAAMRDLVVGFRRRYAAAKREVGGLDFDDLQLETLDLFESRPDIAAAWREHFRLVMVDEFQDTNALQLRLVRALAGENLCTVGDARQSIYRFRGADVDSYREHVAAMRGDGAETAELADNYRSHSGVLEFVNAVFSTNAVFGPERFLALNARREPMERGTAFAGAPRVELATYVRGVGSRDAEREAEFVAARFAELRDTGVDPSSMAVLVRAYSSASTIADALREQGMLATVLGGSGFFGLPEIASMRAFCAVLANPHDDTALAQLLAGAFAELTDDALWSLRNHMPADGGRARLHEALGDAVVPLADTDRAAVALALAVLQRARERVGRVPLSEVMLRALEESAWDLRLLGLGEAGRQAYANVLKLARLADEFESGGGSGPAAFVEHMDAMEDSDDRVTPATLAGEDSPAVRIMSIHAAKGLEFDVVAVPRLGESLRGGDAVVRYRAEDGELRFALALPASEGKEKSHHTVWFAGFEELEATAEAEEKKRLLYVACTRAREKLLLVGGTNRDGGCTAGTPLALIKAAVEEIRAGGGAVPAALVELDEASDEPEPPVSRDEYEPASEPLPPAPPGERECGGPLAPDRLSYSDIALFRRCGLRFYGEKVLRVGRAAASERGDPREFGTAVHTALQLATTGGMPSAARLAALARGARLDERGSARLADAVTRYERSAVAAEARAFERVWTEAPFIIPVGCGRFLLRGSMDVYSRSGDSALVVDYKTGVSGEADDLRERYALQAACYGLVALRDGCDSVRVVFVRPEVEEAGQPQAVEFGFRPADTPAIEEQLLADHERMAAGEYAPLPERREDTCGDCGVGSAIGCPRADERRHSSHR
jgi:ATP-dependent helicase/nuclease subunit A